MIGLLEKLVEFEECIAIDEDAVIVNDATFLKDFGPFTKGHTAVTLQLVFNNTTRVTTLEALDEAGNNVLETPVRLEVA